MHGNISTGEVIIPHRMHSHDGKNAPYHGEFFCLAKADGAINSIYVVDAADRVLEVVSQNGSKRV